MIISITSLDMTEEYDLVCGVAEDGTQTILSANNHQVVSNLVRARLQHEIDWRIFVENTAIDDSIIAQQMRFVIANTHGVSETNFINFSSDRTGRSINLSGVCFTVDCDNSQEVFEL